METCNTQFPQQNYLRHIFKLNSITLYIEYLLCWRYIINLLNISKQMEPDKSKMEYRYLGPTGIKVSVISYGNWVNSNSQEAEDNTIKCVQTAWDHGVNFFDTAELYGFGEAERQIGKAIRLLNVPRHQYVLSTKIFFGIKQDLPNRIGLSRKHIIEGMKKSLKNLEFDYVDMVFCHRPDPETPMEETCRAYDWLVRKGWTFYWGTSEWSAPEIAEAFMVCEKYGLVKPIAEQPQYNLFERTKIEIDFKKFFEKKVLGSTIFSPLASGILTGKYNNGIPEKSRFDLNPDLIRIYERHFTATKQKTLASLNKLQAIAKELNCSMAQLALAWVINNPDISTAITGASNPNQLVDSFKALEIKKKFTAELQQRIEDVFQTSPTGKRVMTTLEPVASRRKEILIDIAK